MKTMFKSIFIKSMSAAALLLTVLGQPITGRAQVYYTVQQLLSEQFRSSERVSYRKVPVTAPLRAKLERELGVRVAKSKYTVYVAMSGKAVDGYALFDEELGQHEMIGFATFFDATGKVTRVEVTAFREPHGDGVRAEQFRRQFVGRGARSGFQPDTDIDAVSGATISSRSLCKGVRRAAAIVDTAILTNAVLASR